MTDRIAEFAAFIIDNMSNEDRATFTTAGWFDGISAMQADGYEDLDTDEVCEYIAAALA